MIDPVVSLAFSLYSGKGTYGLLLGSGLSRAAEIPTGWDILLDLTRKLAAVMREDPEPDPAAWFTRRFRREPDYSDLLKRLAKSPAERQSLLKGYFEPTESEREQGRRLPTKAHKAIADLVARGYIRVIITTNFDRLIEQALEAVGVAPTVISTADAAKGALPLAHSPCTVIKVHGDYLDTRIKNTPEELARFDSAMNELLDQVFDEYGLVVCGWSAEWDAALRAAIERCRSRRFTTYWCIRGHASSTAERLIRLRQAVRASIRDADLFFPDLAAKVLALEEYGRPHPLTVASAVATLKRYLSEERHRISVHDLVMEEMERVSILLTEEHFPVRGRQPTIEEFAARLHRYEGLTEILCALMITGCYWDRGAYRSLWSRCLERIANPRSGGSGVVAWLEAMLYPALLLVYSGGISSLAAGQYDTFASLCLDAKVQEHEERPVVLRIYPVRVIDNGWARQLPGHQEGEYTPTSNHLYEVLRPSFRDVLPEDAKYDKAFDLFEYLYALVHADVQQQERGDIWGPFGRFGWKDRLDAANHIAAVTQREVDALGEDWPPLQAGLFGGSMERLRIIKTQYDERITRLPWGL